MLGLMTTESPLEIISERGFQAVVPNLSWSRPARCSAPRTASYAKFCSVETSLKGYSGYCSPGWYGAPAGYLPWADLYTATFLSKSRSSVLIKPAPALEQLAQSFRGRISESLKRTRRQAGFHCRTARPCP